MGHYVETVKDHFVPEIKPNSNLLRTQKTPKSFKQYKINLLEFLMNYSLSTLIE